MTIFINRGHIFQRSQDNFLDLVRFLNFGNTFEAEIFKDLANFSKINKAKLFSALFYFFDHDQGQTSSEIKIFYLMVLFIA